MNDNFVVVETSEDNTVVIPTEISILREDGSTSVITQESTQWVNTATDNSYVAVANGAQGPQGIPGQSTNFVSVLAGEDLGGSRVVYLDTNGYARYPNMSSTYSVLGITTGAVSSGGPAEVQIVGLITEPSWSFIPNEPVFVGNNGQLTQVPPIAGISLIIGVAVLPNRINIDKQPPIELG